MVPVDQQIQKLRVYTIQGGDMKKALQTAAGLLMTILCAVLDMPEDRRRSAEHCSWTAGERYCSNRGAR